MSPDKIKSDKLKTSIVIAPGLWTIKFRRRVWVPLVFVLADLVALEIALLVAIVVREELKSWWPITVGPKQYSGLALGILIIPLIYYLKGLYPGYGLGPVERLRSRVYTTLCVFAVLITWNYMLQDTNWSRGILLVTLFFALWLPPLFDHWAREILVMKKWFGIPVVVLGAGNTGAFITHALRSQPGIGFVPVAIFDDDPAKWNTTLQGVPIVGPLSDAGAFNKDVRVAVLAMPGMGGARLTTLLHRVSYPRVIVIPDLIGMQSLWVSACDMGGVLGLEVKKNLLVRSNRLFKRTLDTILGLPLLLLSLPVLAFFAIWIKKVSSGPAFYSQTREGAHGKQIRIWKLRTMYPEAEALLDAYLARHPEERENWERFFKLKKDTRVLPGVGQFLRRSSLDELPQLWNVFKGEMSLVGPRPLPPYHLSSFPSDFRELRCSVPAGLTGLWQISARSDGDLVVHESLDTYYIRNWSLWLDLHILARTAMIVLRRKGAY